MQILWNSTILPHQAEAVQQVHNVFVPLVMLQGASHNQICLKTGLRDDKTNISFKLIALSKSQAGSNLSLPTSASTHLHS